jgi:hypothetical protein
MPLHRANRIETMAHSNDYGTAAAKLRKIPFPAFTSRKCEKFFCLTETFFELGGSESLEGDETKRRQALKPGKSLMNLLSASGQRTP